MAGIKGKCGGYRPGAGRKPKATQMAVNQVTRRPVVNYDDTVEAHPTQVVTTPSPALPTPPPPGKDLLVDIDVTDDPVEFLMKLVNNPLVDYKSRMKAAVTAAQYKATRTKDGGKKERQQEEAESVVASKSKFVPMAPPRLTAVK